MSAKKSARSLAAMGTETKFNIYRKNKVLKPICQVHTLILWLIRSNLIKNLVLQRYADILLVLAGFIEGMCHGWN